MVDKEEVLTENTFPDDMMQEALLSLFMAGTSSRQLTSSASIQGGWKLPPSSAKQFLLFVVVGCCCRVACCVRQPTEGGEIDNLRRRVTCLAVDLNWIDFIVIAPTSTGGGRRRSAESSLGADPDMQQLKCQESHLMQHGDNK